MTEAIGKVGDPQGQESARVGGAPAHTDAASGQLGKMLALLAKDFGGFSSPEEIAVMLGSVRLVVGTGLPAVDVADAMYSIPLVLDAMMDGDPTVAKQAVIEHLTGNLAELRDSGVPEAGLRTLSASGFAAGEIVSALSAVAGLREGMMQADPAQWKQLLPTLHETFRENGRSTHDDPAILAALGERMVPGLGGARGAWFEPYWNRIHAARKRTIGAVRPEDYPELMLSSAPAQMPVDESYASFGPWIIASLLAIAALLFILSRC